MVSRQIHARGVRDAQVLAAMGKVRREAFVPEHLCDLAYADRPLPIAAEQTISQPYIVACMIEALALEGLSWALAVAAEMTKSHKAEVVYVGVYGNVSTVDVPPPGDYAAALKAFSDQQVATYGIKATSVPLFSHDPQAELTSAILSAAVDAKADVIVMASHVPGWIEHIFHSNAGYIACHATISVFVVR